MYAAATLSIGANIVKRGSLLAACLLLDPRQRGDRRLARTGASGQHLQDPRIQRQRRLFNLPLQPVLIHHLPQPGYGAEKSVFAQYTTTSASATPPSRPPQETGGSGRSTCSDTARHCGNFRLFGDALQGGCQRSKPGICALIRELNAQVRAAAPARRTHAGRHAVADIGENLPELEAQLLEFGRGIGDGAGHGSGRCLALPRMPLQRGRNKPPPATRLGEHRHGVFSLSRALRWRWVGDRRARQSATTGASILSPDDAQMDAAWCCGLLFAMRSTVTLDDELLAHAEQLCAVRWSAATCSGRP